MKIGHTLAIKSKMSGTTVCQGAKIDFISCPSCKNDGKLTTLVLSIPGQQKQVLNTFECDPCNIKDTAILPYIDKDERGGVRIDCHFILKENEKNTKLQEKRAEETYDLRKNDVSADPKHADLSRYILLTPNTKISFEKEDFTYTFEIGKDTYTCLELLLRNIMEDIKNIYQLKLQDESVYNPKDDESSLNVSDKKDEEPVLKPEASLNSLEEKQAAKSALLAFDSFLHDLNFKMTIIDSTGFSRVFPLNQSKKEMVDDDFFKLDNDADVVHTWFEREEE